MTDVDQAPLDLRVAALAVGAGERVDGLEKPALVFQRIDRGHRLGPFRPGAHRLAAPQRDVARMRTRLPGSSGRSSRGGVLRPARLQQLLAVRPRIPQRPFDREVDAVRSKRPDAVDRLQRLAVGADLAARSNRVTLSDRARSSFVRIAELSRSMSQCRVPHRLSRHRLHRRCTVAVIHTTRAPWTKACRRVFSYSFNEERVESRSPIDENSDSPGRRRSWTSVTLLSTTTTSGRTTSSCFGQARTAGGSVPSPWRPTERPLVAFDDDAAALDPVVPHEARRWFCRPLVEAVAERQRLRVADDEDARQSVDPFRVDGVRRRRTSKVAERDDVLLRADLRGVGEPTTCRPRTMSLRCARRRPIAWLNGFNALRYRIGVTGSVPDAAPDEGAPCASQQVETEARTWRRPRLLLVDGPASFAESTDRPNRRRRAGPCRGCSRRTSARPRTCSPSCAQVRPCSPSRRWPPVHANGGRPRGAPSCRRARWRASCAR